MHPSFAPSIPLLFFTLFFHSSVKGVSLSTFRRNEPKIVIGRNQSLYRLKNRVFQHKTNTELPYLPPLTEPPFVEKRKLSVGIVLPASTFMRRRYQQEIKKTVYEFTNDWPEDDILKYFKFDSENIVMSTMPPSSSPFRILETICDSFLPRNVSAILYLFDNEQFGRSTASVQYFYQLAGYLGIPIISWNADNSGLERRTWSLQLQLAPSIEHQAAAMLSILQRYSWPKFAIVTTLIAGHNDFIQAVREQILLLPKQGTEQEFVITNVLHVKDPEQDLVELKTSEARILFLYATRDEAAAVMKTARDYKLTGKNYLWIVTQSVIQSDLDEPPNSFPVGMLGVHFGTSREFLMSEISTAVKVFIWGTKDYVSDAITRGAAPDLSPVLSCHSGNAKWAAGNNYYRFLKNVSIGLKNSPHLEFNPDGTRKAVQLKIMNLKPQPLNQKAWEEIGEWYSWKQQLEIKDIVWPGHSPVPPNGIPEKFHLKITFMEEPAFINMAHTNPVTGKCPADKGVLCRIATEEMMVGVNISEAQRNSSYYRCCSGFCIDLLVMFSNDLGFSYDFTRVEDGIWGAIVNGKWTGLPGAILANKADMIMTSIKINSQREQVLEFTVPFLDTGIAMVVSKRTGIISPTAFLEPFDLASWMLVAFVAIQVAAVAIFLFEWLSPSGYNMKMKPPRDHPFSLARTLWLVWAILFQAAVNVDCPKGFTARFMGNVWSMFALIFLAIYTANLAAFMITREEFHDMSGLDDKRLQNPTSVKPLFKFGTTLHGHTDVVLKAAFPEMHAYMRQFNQSDPLEGVKAVKRGQLDAFIYDATVLEYLTGQDDECKLLTVGTWYALTGYGVAFPRNSKYLKSFNDQILKYRESGELERLARFWFTGACKADQPEDASSEPLAFEQFMSTFVMLGIGVIFGAFLLALEHLYFKKLRKHLLKRELTTECCNLISMSMGKSITMHEVVQDAREKYYSGHCDDPICDTQLWRVKHELDMARLRIVDLETQMATHGIIRYDRSREFSDTDDESDIPLLNGSYAEEWGQIHEPIRGPLIHTRYHGPEAIHRVREVAELETVL